MTLSDDLLTDLDKFLETDEFAVSVLWSGSGIAIEGIFDNAFVTAELDGAAVETTQPQVLVKTSDVPGIAHGDTMTINSIVYKVIGPHPDGTGMTLVLISQD